MRKTPEASGVFLMERVTRIELALSAWEADVLPLNYTRGDSQYASPPARQGETPIMELPVRSTGTAQRAARTVKRCALPVDKDVWQ